MSLSFIQSLTFGTNERNMGHAVVVDHEDGFVYTFYQTPTSGRGGIAKIRESDFTRVQNLDFASGIASATGGGAAIHKASGYAYFTTSNSQRLKQLNLAGFSVGLDTFFGSASGEIIPDSTGTYLYSVYDQDNTARRILATSLGLVNSASITGGTTQTPVAVAVDFSNGYMWVGRNDTSGFIHQIRLSDFTVVNTISTGVASCFSASIDTLNGFVYFAANGRLIKIRLSTGALVTITGTGFAGSNAGQIIACPNVGVIYSSNGNSTQIYEIDIATLTISDTLSIAGVGQLPGLARNPVTGMLYATNSGNPGIISQVQGLPDPPSVAPMSGGPNVKRRPYPYDSRIISNIY